MSRLAESHGRSDLSKSFFHLLFKTAATSLVLTPMLNQKSLTVSADIRELIADIWNITETVNKSFWLVFLSAL